MVVHLGFELFAERAFLYFKHHQLPLKGEGFAIQPRGCRGVCSACKLRVDDMGFGSVGLLFIIMGYGVWVSLAATYRDYGLVVDRGDS